MNWETTQSIDIFRKARLASRCNKKSTDTALKDKTNNRDNFDKTGALVLVSVGMYIILSSIIIN